MYLGDVHNLFPIRSLTDQGFSLQPQFTLVQTSSWLSISHWPVLAHTAHRQWLFLTQHRNASFLFPHLSLTSSQHTTQNTSHEGHGDSPTTRSHTHSSTISIGLPMPVLPDYLIAAMAQEGEIVCRHVAKPHRNHSKTVQYHNIVLHVTIHNSFS